MATTAANAVRLDLAQRRMNAAMVKLSARHGVPVPPPVKANTPDMRRTKEAERFADFFESLLNTSTGE